MMGAFIPREQGALEDDKEGEQDGEMGWAGTLWGGWTPPCYGCNDINICKDDLICLQGFSQDNQHPFLENCKRIDPHCTRSTNIHICQPNTWANQLAAHFDLSEGVGNGSSLTNTLHSAWPCGQETNAFGTWDFLLRESSLPCATHVVPNLAYRNNDGIFSFQHNTPIDSLTMNTVLEITERCNDFLNEIHYNNDSW